MPKDEWIDKELSNELPVIRDKGEGQHIEFKENFPKNGNDLSKEIAAFASSNSGKILIGVADDGTLVGLKELKASAERDQLCRRIEGLCANKIKPSIIPVIRFAQEDDKSVLVIEVPRGQQPIYYSDSKPYIRHHSQSRPAEPHEVIERVIEWSNSSPFAPRESVSPEDASKSHFLSTLASTLIEVLIFGEELEARSVNPWLDELRIQFGAMGKTLRELASKDIAINMSLDGQLRELANILDRVENHRLVLGKESWEELKGYVTEAVAKARKLKADQIDPLLLSENSMKNHWNMIHSSARQLEDFNNRAEQMANESRIEELQSAASEIGYDLLRISYFPIKSTTKDFGKELHAIAQDLHLIGTKRLYMDGGKSMQDILSCLHEYKERLQALTSQEGNSEMGNT